MSSFKNINDKKNLSVFKSNKLNLNFKIGRKMKKKLFLLIIILLCQNVKVYSSAMTNNQLASIFKQIADNFGISSNAANLGDKYTACSEARNGLRLFFTIDVQDLTEEQKIWYYKGAISAREMVQSVNSTCN